MTSRAYNTKKAGGRDGSYKVSFWAVVVVQGDAWGESLQIIFCNTHTSPANSLLTQQRHKNRLLNFLFAHYF
jgi:hypothetical protein